MLQKRKLLTVLNCVFFVVLSLFILDTVLALEDNFLNKSISYEYGSVKPKLRETNSLNDYFKSLEIEEDYIYTLVLFESNLTEKQRIDLENDNVKLIGRYDVSLYLYRFPKRILETKTYAFIKWIDVPTSHSKIEPNFRNFLNSNSTLLVKMEFYENYTDEELKKINRYAKFTNKEDWEPEEHKIVALVGPKENAESVHGVEEIAMLNFIKSLRLINVEDKRKLNLFVDQSEFYENTSLVNQPHSICPWEKSDRVESFPNLDESPTIVKKKSLKLDDKLREFNKSNKFAETHDFVKSQGMNLMNDVF